MATQLWSTGPALFYVLANGAPLNNAKFLGTCDDKPLIEIEEEYEDLHNDIGGNRRFDRMFEGESGMTVADFGKFDYFVAQQISAMRASDSLGGDATAVPGESLAGDIGTIMGQEGKAFQLVIAFPYFLKPAYGAGGAGGMVAGYRFPLTTVNKQSIASGTTAHKRRVVFEHDRKFDYSYRNIYGVGRFVLYDHLASILQLPPPV